MSIWGQLSQTIGHAWDGNAAAVGDTAGIMMAMAGKLPGAGALLPDFGETSDAVNGVLGIDPKQETEGNTGNHVGTVVGGLAGLIGGPAGAALGAGLGSAAGGWIAEILGDDSNKTSISRTPAIPHTEMVPE